MFSSQWALTTKPLVETHSSDSAILPRMRGRQRTRSMEANHCKKTKGHLIRTIPLEVVQFLFFWSCAMLLIMCICTSSEVREQIDMRRSRASANDASVSLKRIKNMMCDMLSIGTAFLITVGHVRVHDQKQRVVHLKYDFIELAKDSELHRLKKMRVMCPKWFVFCSKPSEEYR